jgi:hypothetical protein
MLNQVFIGSICIVRDYIPKLIRDSIYKKYFEAFNFYFAKPINEILANVPGIDHIVYFKDYLVWDEEGEYLKR